METRQLLSAHDIDKKYKLIEQKHSKILGLIKRKNKQYGAK